MSGIFTGSSLGTVQFATFDPANKGANLSLSGGNLILNNSGVGSCRTTITCAGKQYWETTITLIGNLAGVGVCNATQSMAGFIGNSANSLCYQSNGAIVKNGSTITTVATYTTADVISVANDSVGGTVQFFKNNVSVATISGANVPTGTLYSAAGMSSSNAVTLTANYGASTLSFSPPSGYAPGLYNQL